MNDTPALEPCPNKTHPTSTLSVMNLPLLPEKVLFQAEHQPQSILTLLVTDISTEISCTFSCYNTPIQ